MNLIFEARHTSAKFAFSLEQPIAGWIASTSAISAAEITAGTFEVTVRRARRPNTDGLISKPHMQRVTVRLAIHRHGADAHLLARADDAQRNLTAICNQYLAEHVAPGNLLKIF